MLIDLDLGGKNGVMQINPDTVSRVVPKGKNKCEIVFTDGERVKVDRSSEEVGEELRQGTEIEEPEHSQGSDGMLRWGAGSGRGRPIGDGKRPRPKPIDDDDKPGRRPRPRPMTKSREKLIRQAVDNRSPKVIKQQAKLKKIVEKRKKMLNKKGKRRVDLSEV